MTDSLKPLANARVTELDAMRVAAFLLLIFYHAGMLYVLDWGWHYKSQYQSSALQSLMLWSNQWRMQLLFFISGAACCLFLQIKGPLSLWRQRLWKLWWPLVFGTLVVVVPQVYIEAKQIGLIEQMPFLEFWQQYLNQKSALFAEHKTLGNWHLTWNHLWYLPYLMAYSSLLSLLWPIFHRVAPRIQLPPNITVAGTLLFPIALFTVIGAWLYRDHPVNHSFFDDWYNHARSFSAFLLGAIFICSPRLWQALPKLRYFLVVSACVSYALVLSLFRGFSFGESWLAGLLEGGVWNTNSWLWLLTVVSWFNHWNIRDSSALRFLNRGVFCFYILHQTCLILYAYWLTPYRLGPIWEPLAVISLTMFTCVSVYVLVQPLPIVNLMLGINSTNRRLEKVPASQVIADRCKS